MNFIWFALRLAIVLMASATVCRGQVAPATGAAKPRVNCQVGNEQPSDAEKALSRRDYKAALDLFQKMETSAPDVSRAGKIRTLIAQGKTQDAGDQAKKWQESDPASEAAIETWGEVLFRMGDLPEALKTVIESRKLDPCNPRAFLISARIENLLGDHATAAHQLAAAHKLAPHEIEVESAWAETLPRSQRIARAAALAKDDTLLNPEDRKHLTESLAHQKDYKAGDCQMVQPIDNAELHMEEIMYDSAHRESFGLYVKLNGHQRTLEIDSGASGILLSRAAASRLGVAHDEKVEVGGIGDEGGVQSAIAHVESIRIGGMEFRNCPVTILEKRDKIGGDGLIGTDFFDKYLVTLDFPEKRVRLNPLPKRPGEAETAAAEPGDDDVPVFHDRYVAPEMKDWTMVWRDGHDLLLPVSIGGAKDKLFIIDTGAGLMSISPSAAREVTKVHGDFDTHVFGISGEVAHVYQTQQFLVTFGHVRLHVGSMTAMDTDNISKDMGFEVSGFLGAPVLNRLVLQIDYRDNLVHLNYDEKNDPENRVKMPYY